MVLKGRLPLATIDPERVANRRSPVQLLATPLTQEKIDPGEPLFPEGQKFSKKSIVGRRSLAGVLKQTGRVGTEEFADRGDPAGRAHH